MFMRGRINKIRTSIVPLFLLLYITHINASEGIENDFKSVPPDQISSIFNMLSEKAYENYTKINTWQGKIDASVNTSRNESGGSI